MNPARRLTNSTDTSKTITAPTNSSDCNWPRAISSTALFDSTDLPVTSTRKAGSTLVAANAFIRATA